MEGVTIVNHPLVQHKLTLMRDKNAPTAHFRQLLREIALLFTYEVTRDLPLTTTTIETPLAKMESPILQGKKPVFASILRAGNGLLEGMLDLVPSARVAHIGIYRDPKTLEPHEYYFKAPDDIADRLTIVVDPDAGHRQFRLGRHQPAEGARSQGHPLRLSARRSGRHRPLPEGPAGHPDLHRGHRRPPQRPRLYRAGPRRCRRPLVRDEVGTARFDSRRCRWLDLA